MISNKEDLIRIYEVYGIARHEYDDYDRALNMARKHDSKVLDLQRKIEREEQMAQRDQQAGNEDSAARRQQNIARLKTQQERARRQKDSAQNKAEKIDNPK
jgi:hypothetical protein